MQLSTLELVRSYGALKMQIFVYIEYTHMHTYLYHIGHRDRG